MKKRGILFLLLFALVACDKSKTVLKEELKPGHCYKDPSNQVIFISSIRKYKDWQNLTIVLPNLEQLDDYVYSSFSRFTLLETCDLFDKEAMDYQIKSLRRRVGAIEDHLNSKGTRK
jgi:hypothetical protein